MPPDATSKEIPVTNSQTAPSLSVHVGTATSELLKALHYYRWHDDSSGPNNGMIGHARKAGEYAAYSGLPYTAWGFSHPEAYDATPLWDAFRSSWFSTIELLNSPRSHPHSQDPQ